MGSKYIVKLYLAVGRSCNYSAIQKLETQHLSESKDNVLVSVQQIHKFKNAAKGQLHFVTPGHQVNDTYLYTKETLNGKLTWDV